ncbi:MAG: hypothetical protein KFH98_16065 [Gemmatimonadetes bacterium]|nr:hypothetical protein [Gemmatimonadota bacterium]
MPGLRRNKEADGGAYTFRVSDVLDVPLRGTVLRLRLVEGTPSMGDLGAGSTLLLRSGSGEERTVTITGHATSSGRATQQRLDRTRELDVVISDHEAGDGGLVGIGWLASGPTA